MSTFETANETGTVSARDLFEKLAKVEEAMADLDLNGRINLMSYAIVGIVIMMHAPRNRENALRLVGLEMRRTMLPQMATLSKAAGPDSPLWPGKPMH